MKQALLTQRTANAVCQTLVVSTFAVSRVATGWSIEDAPSQSEWPHSEKGRTPFSEAWKSALGSVTTFARRSLIGQKLPVAERGFIGS